MSFIPIDRMWKQVEIAQAQSESELFNRLMYFGEMLTKIAAAGLVAAIHRRARWTPLSAALPLGESRFDRLVEPGY